MKVIVVKNASELGKQAFDLLAKAVAGGAKTLGLATGSSPVELYQEMVASQLDFSQMTSVNLDEYVGLSPENPQSYHYFMNQHLFQYKPFKRSYLPDGQAEDIQAECGHYNQILADNPVDLQVLGIGQNGHIAFNEPGTPFDSITHEVALTESTIKATPASSTALMKCQRAPSAWGLPISWRLRRSSFWPRGKARLRLLRPWLKGQ